MEKGIGIFGKQYEYGYKNETHAAGSVVRTLFDEMIKLDENSAEYLYNSYTDLSPRYKIGSRPFLEKITTMLMGDTDMETVQNIITDCRNSAMTCEMTDDDFIYGGTEEDVMERRSYWCTDLARVACILFQIAGFPARILVTANTNFPYCGHTVTEVYYNGKWCATDPNAGVVFNASAWEIHNDYEIANKIYSINDPNCMEGNGIFFPPGEQFESVGIVNYYVDEMEKYDYTTSDTNDFYKKILQNSAERWSGGLKWIFGEELL